MTTESENEADFASNYVLVFCEPLLENGFKSWPLTKQRTVVGFDAGRPCVVFRPIAVAYLLIIELSISECDIVVPTAQPLNLRKDCNFEVVLGSPGQDVSVKSPNLRAGSFLRLDHIPAKFALVPQMTLTLKQGAFMYISAPCDRKCELKART